MQNAERLTINASNRVIVSITLLHSSLRLIGINIRSSKIENNGMWRRAQKAQRIECHLVRLLFSAHMCHILICLKNSVRWLIIVHTLTLLESMWYEGLNTTELKCEWGGREKLERECKHTEWQSNHSQITGMNRKCSRSNPLCTIARICASDKWRKVQKCQEDWTNEQGHSENLFRKV